MNRDELVLRFLCDELSREEREEFSAMLQADTTLQSELAFMKQLREESSGVLAAETQSRLHPFFADRLMKSLSGVSLERTRQEEFVSSLIRWFSPVTAVSLAIIIVLVVGNLSGRDSGSVADSVLGLPSVTVANVYDLDYE